MRTPGDESCGNRSEMLAGSQAGLGISNSHEKGVEGISDGGNSSCKGSNVDKRKMFFEN